MHKRLANDLRKSISSSKKIFLDTSFNLKACINYLGLVSILVSHVADFNETTLRIVVSVASGNYLMHTKKIDIIIYFCFSRHVFNMWQIFEHKNSSSFLYNKRSNDTVKHISFHHQIWFVPISV